VAKSVEKARSFCVSTDANRSARAFRIIPHDNVDLSEVRCAMLRPPSSDTVDALAMALHEFPEKRFAAIRASHRQGLAQPPADDLVFVTTHHPNLAYRDDGEAAVTVVLVAARAAAGDNAAVCSRQRRVVMTVHYRASRSVKMVPATMRASLAGHVRIVEECTSIMPGNSLQRLSPVQKGFRKESSASPLRDSREDV
jgi:hypothetical protein